MFLAMVLTFFACDARSSGSLTFEGQKYKTVKIGTQTWMAENLKYNAPGSKCYNDDYNTSKDGACNKYGRLYNWATAMALPASCNESECASQIQPKHRGICPKGWHIPSNAEWDQLFRYVDGNEGTESPYDSETAGKYLKAKEGWNGSGNGEDTYGFSALPGGFGYSGGNFDFVGNFGLWWSSFESNSSNAYGRLMRYYDEDAYGGNGGKSHLYSVRCTQD
jgi:uncharacterized protein (TIGR02145 family)